MSSTADVEELLRHSAWMKRLATRLSRDGAAADDLVQDAWVAALNRPPRSGSTVRSWLGQVLRNTRREDLRAGSRAARREIEAAEVHAPEPSVESLVGTAELGRILAVEVLRLPEPFRSTLLLVFYEGLTPSEIAARDLVPPGTVRWRLKEGLDRLRAELDQRHGGDRKAWLAILAPLTGADRARPPSSSTLTGGLAMKIGLATLCSAVAVSAALSIARPSQAEMPKPQARASAPTPAVPARTAGINALKPSPATRAAHDKLLAQVILALQARAPAKASPRSLRETPPTLDPDYISAQVRELSPLLQECYENALRGQPDLRGRLVVAFTIVGDPSVGGLVGESTIDEADPTLGNDTFLECVQETMYGARFAAPPAGGEVKVRYPFSFSSAK